MTNLGRAEYETALSTAQRALRRAARAADNRNDFPASVDCGNLEEAVRKLLLDSLEQKKPRSLRGQARLPI